MEKTKSVNDFPLDVLREMFRRMTLVREFELRAIEERHAGLIPGFIHSCVGQEATAVGACLALEKDDVITSTHRGHGHLVAKGGDPKYMMAELAARSPGYCLGRGGSLHIADFDLGILGANGIVAGGIPIAVGASLAFAMRKEPHLALAFFGDGATNEGAFHEAANMAGTWNLPVIFFCENNLYGEGTHIDRCTPIKDLAIRADGYGIPGVIVDGNDILAVYEAVSQAAERARSGKGSTFIEAKTYRQRGHYEGDPQVYRTQEEIKKWKRHDPILLFKSSLIESGLIDDGDLEEIQGEVITQLDQAVGFAADAPKPEPEDARAGVYDNIHDGLVF
jgi:acetoin:2,6-dichlorophenolindophenol oxidoreductase subunit alpha